ncbi:hypothetical protein B0H10DRAFT_2031971 [Mycena sp. CBHHK59/15]|nr:hypothetical protein B0H10DRAFT_2136754 [Mycena sp. CBHHK59/15]KAJ6572350.1 hypothetical protein B0H10DRAFT_2106844 [Mycena sp. CBHHK59/15]KAJ6608168.1 hypothetical protein B0H10DRAFT_2068834 [Mycena sp. CBHHK59/15]KAJ6617844.1 hypothetical protein B0H10DRAFT_2031971 [Mycena sp. CBHHK59/15]
MRPRWVQRRCLRVAEFCAGIYPCKIFAGLLGEIKANQSACLHLAPFGVPVCRCLERA